MNQAPCPRCALPFQEDLCPACRLDPPPFVETLAPFIYSPPLNKALQNLKYRNKIHLVREISKLWKRALPFQLSPDLWVCPVPLHRRRLLKRGFNQSQLLATQIFGAQKVKELLIRERHTKPQVTLTYRERLKNVRGAFRAQNASFIRGKKILLFDDIFTTGATLKECARVLLKAGAEEVRVAVIARAE